MRSLGRMKRMSRMKRLRRTSRLSRCWPRACLTTPKEADRAEFLVPAWQSRGQKGGDNAPWRVCNHTLDKPNRRFAAAALSAARKTPVFAI
ncbi:hypothetical protein B8V81_4531 [Paenibacillus pasadenensis]|uniref:Uncharacterized protein n=1 Tax=Paenibacillus pasadenensis TaxID=217090 RepID=A0A2N5N717_9BACL|nr:hypothetical protein B8V81_4531 [Paenibacillus pasadenensis]